MRVLRTSKNLVISRCRFAMESREKYSSQLRHDYLIRYEYFVKCCLLTKKLRGWCYGENVSRHQSWQEPILIKQGRNRASCFVHLGTCQHCAAKKRNETQGPTHIKWPVHFINFRILNSIALQNTLCHRTCLGAQETKCHDWRLKKQKKLMWLDKASLNSWTHDQHHAWKRHRIGSEKTSEYT